MRDSVQWILALRWAKAGWLVVVGLGPCLGFHAAAAPGWAHLEALHACAWCEACWGEQQEAAAGLMWPVYY
jgi:hypothetical protein